MRLFGLLLTLVAGLGLSFGPNLKAKATEKNKAERIDRLINKLGSNKFAEREDASKALEDIGVPSLEGLQEAVKSSDEEVRQRAEELIKKITRRAEMERILAPTRVHLVYKDTPVEEAVADFAKKTGYPIVLLPQQHGQSQRKVTLDTGDTTFWKAFDQFCQQAELMESSPQVVPGRQGPRPPVRPLPVKGAALPAGGGGAVVVVAAVAAGPAAVVPAPVAGGPVLVPGPVPSPYIVQPAFPAMNGQLILAGGKPETRPTYYAGAIRIQALPTIVPNFVPPRRDGEILFSLDVTPEPKIQWRNLLGWRLDKAVDENDQALEEVTAFLPPSRGVPPGMMIARQPVYYGNLRQVPVRLQEGVKPTKVIKELKGTLSAQVQTQPEAVMTVNDILNATKAAQVKGPDGGFLKILDVNREDGGNVKIHLQMELPPNVFPAGPMGMGIPVGVAPGGAALAVRPGGLILPGGAGFQGLALLDSKGQAFQMVGVNATTAVAGGAVNRELTLTYQPQKDQGEPAKLIFSGSRLVTIEVPFSLKDIPLS